MKNKICLFLACLVLGASFLCAGDFIYTPNGDGSVTAAQIISKTELAQKISELNSLLKNIDVQIDLHQQKLADLGEERIKVVDDLEKLDLVK